MRALAPSTLLDAWEQAQGHGPTVRALALLAAAGPQAWEELSALPLGERDRRLLELREGALGPRRRAPARSPGGGEPLDVELDAGELRAGAGTGAAEGELSHGGLELRFRLLDILDLFSPNN